MLSGQDGFAQVNELFVLHHAGTDLAHFIFDQHLQRLFLFSKNLLHLPQLDLIIYTDANADAETDADTQYVLYLGTNDKDTNKPVFTQSESLEKTREILMRHFGGYTIQEALGGWIDNDTEYQEFTLVIYLSDTSLDAVHAAADELVETFHQSSVMIQANPTKTEFYSGAD